MKVYHLLFLWGKRVIVLQCKVASHFDKRAHHEGIIPKKVIIDGGLAEMAVTQDRVIIILGGRGFLFCFSPQDLFQH